MQVRALKHREQVFVEQILLGKSAQEADIIAGFSAKAARTEGPKRLQKPAVAAELAKRRSKLVQKTEDLQDRILRELEKKAFQSFEEVATVDEDGNLRLDFSKASPELLSTLNKVETKTRKVYTPKGDHIATEVNVKVGKDDSMRALQLLGQTLGMFKSDEVKVTVDVADRLLAARQRLHALPGPTHEDTE